MNINMKICRFCLENINSLDHIVLTEGAIDHLVLVATKQMLNKVLPNLKLNIVEKPLICSTCYVALCDAYLCNKTEELFKRLEPNVEKISRFISNNPGFNLEYSDFLNVTVPNGLVESNSCDADIMFITSANENENAQYVYEVEGNKTNKDVVYVSDEETDVVNSSLKEPSHDNGGPSNDADKSSICKSIFDSEKVSDMLIDKVYSLAEEMTCENASEDIDGVSRKAASDKNNASKNNTGKSVSDGKKLSDVLMDKVYSLAEDADDTNGMISLKAIIRKCCLCEKIFAYKCDLLIHLYEHAELWHDPRRRDTVLWSKSNSCDVCKQSYSNKSALADHRLLAHGIRPFACPVCQKTFKLYRTLQIHTLETHTKLATPKCKICYIKFRYKGELRKHMAVKHKEEDTKLPKDFKCETCSTEFNTEEDLENDRTGHSAALKSVCTNCTKIPEEDEETDKKKGAKKYICLKCDLRMKSCSTFAAHVINEHSRRFVCVLCKSLCGTSLKIHNRHALMHKTNRHNICACGNEIKLFFYNG